MYITYKCIKFLNSLIYNFYSYIDAWDIWNSFKIWKQNSVVSNCDYVKHNLTVYNILILYWIILDDSCENETCKIQARALSIVRYFIKHGGTKIS